jgi:hypothetical protein
MIGPSDIQIILGKVRPLSRPLTEAHPQVLIIARSRFEVDSNINGPAGQGTLKTVWQVENGVPRLITNWLEVHR